MREWNCFGPELTDEDAYALGALLSDGNRSRKNTLGLTSTDKDFVDKVRKHIAPDIKLHYRAPRPHFCKKRNKQYIDAEAWGFSVGCTAIAARLDSLGMVANKSETAVVVDELKPLVPFWRAMFDGDGTITHTRTGTRTTPRLELKGSVSTLEVFREYAFEFLGKKNRKTIHAQGGGEKVSRIVFCGDEALRLIQHLYNNAPEHMRMERKYKLARELTGNFTYQGKK